MAKGNTYRYRYADLRHGLSLLGGQVDSVNQHRKVAALQGIIRPQLSRERLQAGYARRWLRHYGFTSKYAKIPKHHEKNVELALAVIEENRRHA